MNGGKMAAAQRESMTANAAPCSEWTKPAFLALSCVGFVSSVHAATEPAANDAGDGAADAAEHETIIVNGQRQDQ